MDIKKLAFKYAEKVALIVTVIILAVTIIGSPMFGDALRPLREGLESFTSIFQGQSQQFRLEQLKADIRDYEQKIVDNLDKSKPPRVTDPTQPEELKTPPPAITVEIRDYLWNEPTDIFEQPKEIFATVESGLTVRDRIKGENLQVTKGANLLKVVVKAPNEFGLLGQREGYAEFEWRDEGNIRHIQIVTIKPYVPEATVSAPTGLKAVMEGAGVRLVWGPSTSIDPRAPVTSYNVYRRKAAESDYKKIGTAPVSAGKPPEGGGAEGAPSPEAAPKGGGTYLDGAIEFDTSYSYVVKAVSDKAKVPESGPCPAAAMDIPMDTEFFLKLIAANNASVKVWKFVNKEWKFRPFNGLKCGEPIGAVYTKAGTGGKPGESVDYRTGAVLVDIDPTATRNRKSIMTMPIKTAAGGFERVDQVQLILDSKGKIVYLGKHGELKEKWMGKETKEALDELYKRFPGVGVPAAKAAEGEAPPAAEEKKSPEEKKATELKPSAVE